MLLGGAALGWLEDDRFRALLFSIVANVPYLEHPCLPRGSLQTWPMSRQVLLGCSKGTPVCICTINLRFDEPSLDVSAEFVASSSRIYKEMMFFIHRPQLAV